MSSAQAKFEKLQRDNLKMMEQRNQALLDVSTFQNALEQKNKEKEQVEAQLAEKDSSLIAAIKRVEEAEIALKLHNDGLLELKKDW